MPPDPALLYAAPALLYAVSSKYNWQMKSFVIFFWTIKDTTERVFFVPTTPICHFSLF